MWISEATCCSDHEMVLFRILRGGRKVKSRYNLGLQETRLCPLQESTWRISWGTVLRRTSFQETGQTKWAMKMIKRLEHQSYEKLCEPGLYSLEKVQGDLINVYIKPDGRKLIRRSWTLFSSAFWKVSWQWEKIEIQKNLSKHKKQFFYYGNAKTLEQVGMRGCWVSVH